MVEPRLPHGGDDDPVARQVDGVLVRLVDRRHFPAAKRAVEGVKRAFSFEGHDEPLLFRAEPSEHGVGKLSLYHHVLLTGQSECRAGARGTGIAENVDEEGGEKFRQQRGFLD